MTQNKKALLAIALIVIALCAVFAGMVALGTITIAPRPVFQVTSSRTWTAQEGGWWIFFNHLVIYVETTITNVGNAPGSTVVYCNITQTNGNFWSQSEGTYLQVGEQQTLKFKFEEANSDKYTFSVWTK